MSIRIDVLDAPGLAADGAWWALYARAFPPDEREPREVILRSLAGGPGLALAARDADGISFGIATAHMLADPPVVFLPYLAVDPERRGGGAGAALFEAAWAVGARHLACAGREALGIAWELDERAEATGGDRGLTAARVRFFERLGGRPLDVRYVQPPVDGVHAVPMRLWFRGRAPAADALVRAIYREKYGAINGIDDAVLERLLR